MAVTQERRPAFTAPAHIDTDVRDRLDEQVAQFERDGMLIIPNAVPVETIDSIRDATDKLMHDLGPAGRWHGKPASMKKRIEYRGLMNLDERFMQLLTPDTVFPLVVKILGANLHLMSTQALYAHPNQPKQPHHGSWHRDLIGSSEDLGYDNTPRMAIRVGYYLNDVSETGSGVTLFKPGSHTLEEPLPLKPGSQDPEDWLRPAVGPGDAVLWENRTFHAAENNESADVRKAVMYQYGYRWLRAVDYISHPPELLERCDAVTRQLLATHDFNEDGSMTRMKGSKALIDWAAEHGLA